MTCPNCGNDPIAEQTPIRNLVICPACLASVRADDGQRAMSEDTLPLTPTELAAIRSRRKSFRGAQVSP